MCVYIPLSMWYIFLYAQNNKVSHSAADNLKRYYGWNYQDIKDVLNPPGGWSKTNKDIILLFCIAIEI